MKTIEGILILEAPLGQKNSDWSHEKRKEYGYGEKLYKALIENPVVEKLIDKIWGDKQGLDFQTRHRLEEIIRYLEDERNIFIRAHERNTIFKIDVQFFKAGKRFYLKIDEFIKLLECEFERKEREEYYRQLEAENKRKEALREAKRRRRERLELSQKRREFSLKTSKIIKDEEISKYIISKINDSHSPENKFEELMKIFYKGNL